MQHRSMNIVMRRVTHTFTRSNTARFTLNNACVSAASSSSLLPSSRSSFTPLIFNNNHGRSFATHAHSSHKPLVLVVGGNGALGQAMLSSFQNAGWSGVSVDYSENKSATHNIAMKKDLDWKGNIHQVEKHIAQILSNQGSKSLSVVIHCAGSWMGGGLKSEQFLATVDPMLEINLKSALATAYFASKFIEQPAANAASSSSSSSSASGLLILTGAGAIMHNAASPGMISYGISKAATHQLVNSLTKPDAGLNQTHVVCLLPTMIDTPSNRAMGASATERENWTPPSAFAELALSFANQLRLASPSASSTSASNSKQTHTKGVSQVNEGEVAIQHSKATVHHGGFYLFTTKKGKTSIELVKQ